jgi:hypothetical protein
MFSLLHVIDAARDETVEALLHLIEDTAPVLPGVQASIAGRTLPRALNGGKLLWRMAFASEADCKGCFASPAFQSEIIPALATAHGVTVDWAAYRAHFHDVSKPKGGIWRCLVFAVDAGTPSATVRAFERNLLLMPAHVSAIRNWALGEVVIGGGQRRWTHVWEQEFDDVGGLEGEYMTSPIHWGLVDGWFDPECPQRIVDPHLIHAALDIDRPVIA